MFLTKTIDSLLSRVAVLRNTPFVHYEYPSNTFPPIPETL